MTPSDILREICENWRSDLIKHGGIPEIVSDLTALISENYVSKEEHEKMKHDLTHCGSCGNPLSRDCPRCKHLWET
jgi:hypothetical protein